MSTKNSNFFSRDCMVQALIQLLKTKSLSNITITELTERAGVSRMTYYRNYHSLDEIFSSYLKDLVELPTVRMLRHGRTRAITMTPAICCIVMNISIITKNSLPVWCRPVWGTCCYRHWTATFWIPIIPKTRGRIFITRSEPSPVPSTIFMSPGFWKIPKNPLKRSYPLFARSIRRFPDLFSIIIQQRTAQNTQSFII